MNNPISNDFLLNLGFDKDGEHYSIHDKIEVYLPSENHCEVYVTADDNPQNYTTHIVRCKTEDDMLILFRLLGLEKIAKN